VTHDKPHPFFKGFLCSNTCMLQKINNVVNGPGVLRVMNGLGRVMAITLFLTIRPYG